MRSITLLLPTVAVAMLAFAPVADAASPSGTAETAGKKPSCKRNPKREALNRGRGAEMSAKAKKCRSGYRTYRGTTSQGERIQLQTRTTEYGTKLLSGKILLTFYARQTCMGSSGVPHQSSQQYTTQNYPALTGTATNAAFKTTIPSFDGEYRYLASVTGKVGVSTASGQVSTEAGGTAGEGGCAATSFNFRIPRIRGGGGF